MKWSAKDGRPMAVFAIVFKESSPQAQQRVQKAYPDCFQLSPTFTVVTTKDVSENRGKSCRHSG